MSLKQKQKLAALKIKRDAFVDAYVGAQLKRANEIKEFKDFSSVITFLDEVEEVLPLQSRIKTNKLRRETPSTNKTKPVQFNDQEKIKQTAKQKENDESNRFDHYAED